VSRSVVPALRIMLSSPNTSFTFRPETSFTVLGVVATQGAAWEAVRIMVAILQMYGYPDSAQDQEAAYSSTFRAQDEPCPSYES